MNTSVSQSAMFLSSDDDVKQHTLTSMKINQTRKHIVYQSQLALLFAKVNLLSLLVLEFDIIHIMGLIVCLCYP